MYLVHSMQCTCYRDRMCKRCHHNLRAHNLRRNLRAHNLHRAANEPLWSRGADKRQHVDGKRPGNERRLVLVHSTSLSVKKQAERAALCRRYLYVQDTMSTAELAAGRQAIADMRAEVNRKRRRQGDDSQDTASKQLLSRVGNSNSEVGLVHAVPAAEHVGMQASLSTCKLMAKNIPENMPVEVVRAHFSLYGEIAGITLSFGESNLVRPHAAGVLDLCILQLASLISH